MEAQKAKMLKEIKKMAQANQHQAAKIMSKDLVRSRQQRNQYLTMSSQLKSMQMQMQSMQMNQNIMTALQGSNAVMSKINEDMNVSEIRDVLKEFNKEMEKSEMKGEMVGDAFDMLEDPGQVGDAEDLYNGVLGEIGLEYNVG